MKATIQLKEKKEQAKREGRKREMSISYSHVTLLFSQGYAEKLTELERKGKKSFVGKRRE